MKLSSLIAWTKSFAEVEGVSAAQNVARRASGPGHSYQTLENPGSVEDPRMLLVCETIDRVRKRGQGSGEASLESCMLRRSHICRPGAVPWMSRGASVWLIGGRTRRDCFPVNTKKNWLMLISASLKCRSQLQIDHQVAAVTSPQLSLIRGCPDAVMTVAGPIELAIVHAEIRMYPFGCRRISRFLHPPRWSARTYGQPGQR